MFRLSARADPAFLAEMLYEAVNWFDDGAEERPAIDVVLARPENARYIAAEHNAGPGPELVQNGSNRLEVQKVSPEVPL